jgi:uncharacterized protein (TIGR02001 family)
MKSKLLNTLMLAALAVPSVAMAEDAPASPHTLTANVSLTTDYIYRGISQTGNKPALQGGFDYAHASGFYAGVWGSSISWISDLGAAGNAGLELDTYFGFRNSFAEDFTYDVGFLRYNYPGTYNPGFIKADTDEIYGAIGWKWVTFKYSYSLGKTFGVADADGTDYIDLSVNYPIADTGITVGAHYGEQTYEGSSALFVAGGGPNASYSDYKLSVSKDFSGYVVSLAYTSTDAQDGPGQFYNVLGNELGKGTGILSVTHAF